MTTIEINYRAIKWDNHQGGSGMPFTDRVVITVSQEDTLEGTIEEAHAQLAAIGREKYVGEVELINIIILN